MPRRRRTTQESPWRKTVALVALVGCAGVVAAVFGLDKGCWRLNHPDPARFPIWGVDVSHHQGPIDWPRVASEPHIAFAFIKATEGGDWTDPRFATNWREARAAGLLVGAYHFFTFCRPPLDQARHFLATAPREPDALPAALDLELEGNCSAVPEKKEVQRDVLLWLEAVERGQGKRPIIYTTSESYEALLSGASFSSVTWIRGVLAEPQRPVGWGFWQFDERARVRGIETPVDLDVFRGDREALTHL